MSKENTASCAKADQEIKHTFVYLFLTIFIPLASAISSRTCFARSTL